MMQFNRGAFWVYVVFTKIDIFLYHTTQKILQILNLQAMGGGTVRPPPPITHIENGIK